MDEHHPNLSASAPCGLITLSDNGTILSVNGYALQLLGYSHEELIDEHIDRLLSLAGRIFYGTHLYPMVKINGIAEEIFLSLRTNSGKTVPVLLNASFSGTGSNIQIYWAFIPIHNRGAYENEILKGRQAAEKKLEFDDNAMRYKETLNSQQELLDQQLAVVKAQHDELVQVGWVLAHDLQEPIRKIVLYSGELPLRSHDNNFGTKAVAIIRRSAQQVQLLLLRLQFYMELDKDGLLKEEVDLVLLIEECIKKLIEEIPDIAVHLNLQPLPPINGNQKQLQAMFYEICRNAFIHGAVEGNLHLTIGAVLVRENEFRSLETRFKYKDFVKITVSDKGPGFESRYNNYIFGMLKKLTPISNSVGMGLSICKRIADLHGGSISAVGSPEKGATFYITLPLR